MTTTAAAPRQIARSLDASRRAMPLNLSALAGAVLCLIAASAAAQQAQDKPSAETAPEKTTLDAVVVTANRKVESARDVPMAIDVISAKDIERYQLLDAKDIARLAPGVEMTNNDGRQNVASMRGVSFSPDTGVSVAAVGVHINEVPVSANVAFNALYDLGQVEVLRGPQGTLRGQMTPAGAITMATRRPHLSLLGGEVLLTVDDHGGRNLKGAFNLPVIADQLAVRFAAVRDENRLNYVRNITNGERSKSETESYRLSVAWQPTDDLRIDFMTQQLNVDNRQTKQMVGNGVVTPFSLGRGPRDITLEDLEGVTDVSDHYDTKATLTTAKATWSLSDHHTLSFVGGYQDIKLDQSYDRDVGNVIPGTSIMQVVKTGIRTHSAELVFSSEGNPFWNYTVGAYYEKTQAQSDVDVASGAFLLTAPGGSTSQALFTRHSFKLTDTLTFDAGARYSQLKTEQQSVASVPGFTFPPSIPANYANVTDKPLTWGLSLTNRFSRSLTGYVAAGHSFRPGTYQVGILNPIDPSLLGMPPEKSDSVEVGFKSDFMERRASLNVAAFVQRYQGYIDRTGDMVYQYVDYTGQTLRDTTPFNNSGDARVQGLEAQLFMRLSSSLDLNLAMSWVKSRYTSGQTPCMDSNGDGIPDGNGPTLIPAGKQVAMCPLRGSIAELPKLSVIAGTEYRFAWGALQPYVGASLNYRPGFHSDKVNYDYAAFTNVLLNTGVRSAKGDWEVGLFVKNALDQRRITKANTGGAVTPVGALGVFDSGYRELNSTAPRVIGISGRYTF